MKAMTIVELVAYLRECIAGAIEDEETGHEDSDALANLGSTMQVDGDRLLDHLIGLARAAEDMIRDNETAALAALPLSTEEP